MIYIGWNVRLKNYIKNNMDIEQILINIPDKQFRWKSTTSKLFKKHLYNFLNDKSIDNCLEIGTNQGLTSLILSYISNKVYTVEISNHNIEEAKKHCAMRNNIEFIIGNAYHDTTYIGCPQYFDAVVIDCLHDYDHVIQDINRALSYTDPDKGIYIIFDDYSHPEFYGVRSAIDDAIQSGLKIESYIGEQAGHVVNTSDTHSFTLIGSEGVILSYGK